MHRKVAFASTAVALIISALVAASPAHAQGCATLSACRDEANGFQILPIGQSGKLQSHVEKITLSLGSTLISSGNMTILVKVPLTSQDEQHLWTLYDSQNSGFLGLMIRGNKMVIDRINQFKVGAARPRYTFDLWEPTINRSTKRPVVIAARFSPDGKFRIDTFSIVDRNSSAGANNRPFVDWEQGKQEVGMPQPDGAFPFGDKVRPAKENSYIKPAYIFTEGVGEIGVYNEALSDDQLIGLVAVLSGVDNQIRVGDSPCNTGKRLSIASVSVSTPCPEGGSLPAQLISENRRQFHSGPRYLRLSGSELSMTTDQLAATSFDINDTAKFNEYTIGITNQGTIEIDGSSAVTFMTPRFLGKPRANANQAWRAVEKVNSSGGHFFALESVAGRGFMCFQDLPGPTGTTGNVRVILCQESTKQIWFDR